MLGFSKAPGIVRLYVEGGVIRSRQGLYLAIPTPAASKFAAGRQKITPSAWERIRPSRSECQEIGRNEV